MSSLENKGNKTSVSDAGEITTRSLRKWGRVVVQHGMIKLISLVLAITLFFYVQYTLNITRSVQVEVLPPKIPQELVLSRKIPPFWKVKFYGKAEHMDFDKSNFQIKLENPNPLVGSNLYRVILYPEPPKDVQATYKRELHLFIDRLLAREFISHSQD